MQEGILSAIIIMGSREKGAITQTSLQPFAALLELVTTALEKVTALQSTQQRLQDLQILNDFSQAIGNETNPSKLYRLIHEEIKKIVGDIAFYIALFDAETELIEIPYLYEGDAPMQVDPFPLGEGLTSIVIRTRQPLMLVEDTEQRAKALGARTIGEAAKSWLGVPLTIGGEVVGVLTVQDVEKEHRFSEDDLRLLTTLSTQIAGVIHNSRLLDESQRRALQLETASLISRDTSATLDQDELLQKAVNLVRDRFEFYQTSVFLLDSQGEYAVIQESTGEAGRQMKMEGYRLQVGSKSIIGHVTAVGEPLVVDDVSKDPTHLFNPLLPDTRSELGIPLKIGERVLGALDVQSTTTYGFSPDDVEVLQILADQLAVAVANAELFTETQEHLAQHRLIHHVTTVAASSSSLEDALSSAVQGLRVTLGDRVAILLVDPITNELRVIASAGYEDDILGFKIGIGEGITGWVAEHSEALLVNDVLNDPRYIAGKESVRSELAVPLNYRGILLGVLNVESDKQNAFDQHDQDILGTLAGSLSAIIVNAQLSDRQQRLFEVTSKIRRSVSMETILETTANELSKVLQIRKASIQVGGVSTAPSPAPSPAPQTSDGNGSQTDSNEEGDEWTPQ
jgi:GAF domain-containing protein